MAVTHMDGFDSAVPSTPEYTIQSTRSQMALSPAPDVGNLLAMSMSAGTASQPSSLLVRRDVDAGWGNRFGFGVLINSNRTGVITFAQIDTSPTAGTNGIITFGKDANNFCTINGVSTDKPFELNVYHYLELELDKVALVARAWLNNELVGTAPMTGSEGDLSYWFGFSGLITSTVLTPIVSYDDLYEADANGTENTNRIGKVKVATRPPQTDFVAEFSRNAGTSNASQVVTNDGDTSYVYSNQEGAVDLYTNSDALPYPDAPVLAVSVTVAARKEGPEARAIAPMIQVDGADEVGDRISLLVNSYTLGTTVFNTNPKTGGAWDSASAADAKFGQTLVL